MHHRDNSSNAKLWRLVVDLADLEGGSVFNPRAYCVWIYRLASFFTIALG